MQFLHPLAGDDANRDSFGDFDEGVNVVREYRGFEPGDVELFEPVADLDGGSDAEAVVCFDHDFDIVADGIADRA